MNDYDRPDIAGECLGVDLDDRSAGDTHVLVTLSVEDDELWHRKLTISSFWLDDLIEVLLRTRARLENPSLYTKGKWGYERNK